MEWFVAKTGFAMFDALHAYGLAILLATASRQPIELQEEALGYHLFSSMINTRDTPSALLEQLFPLPRTIEDFQTSAQDLQHPSLPVAVLDGLLAALFTTRGPRVVSVSDLLNKQRLESSTVAESLIKVSRAIEGWRKKIDQLDLPISGWTAEVLRDYEQTHPSLPIPAYTTRTTDITVPLTIDPAFGYSLRRSRSDGLVTHKTNLTLHGARYAALLAYIGASRFLRAHRLTEKQVNFYVLLARRLTIDQATVLPLLFAETGTAQHAAVRLWLIIPHHAQFSHAEWRGLAYQTLQTQGIRQSLSLNQGYLDYAWLTSIERDVGQGVINFWQAQLHPCSMITPDEREHLLDCLTEHHLEVWIAHLHDVSRHIHQFRGEEIRPYSLNEIRRITLMMYGTGPSTLRHVLEREEGTLNFGHALWLLGRYNRGILRELLELLETAQTLDQLIRALHRVVQECVLALRSYPYIIVPSRDDFIYLLDDVQQHGVQLIAGLLLILSGLRYHHIKECNKYEVHTLISVLLLVAKNSPLLSEAENASLGEIDEALPAEFVTESFEGEE